MDVVDAIRRPQISRDSPVSRSSRRAALDLPLRIFRCGGLEINVVDLKLKNLLRAASLIDHQPAQVVTGGEPALGRVEVERLLRVRKMCMRTASLSLGISTSSTELVRAQLWEIQWSNAGAERMEIVADRDLTDLVLFGAGI